MSKDFILGRIGKNLAKDMTLDERQGEVADRLKKTPSGILPKTQENEEALLKQFTDKLNLAQASVAMTTKDGLREAISDWLRSHNLPADIRLGCDERLELIDENSHPPLTVRHGPSNGHDLVGLSHAECGICETGTLALLSGPQNPTSLNFLPENHIVVVERSDLISHYEGLWPRLRQRYGSKKMPRTVNLITGPSRSADIEQTLLLGAHGPLRLHVIIVGK